MEILVWEDGYFYKPLLYSVNGKPHNLKELVIINYRITDDKWIQSSMLLCRNKRIITKQILEKYRAIRYLSRKDCSMNASMFSAFFYLISEAYSKINLEHRLVLLMHICDGVAIQFLNGSTDYNAGNINIILNNLNAKEYKNTVKMLGIPSSRAKEALGYTRNELTHFEYKTHSLGSYISNPNTETDNLVNLYVFHILENALRISILKVLGIEVDDEIKQYIMDDNSNWIRLNKHLDSNCIIPHNMLQQAIERINKNNIQK